MTHAGVVPAHGSTSNADNGDPTEIAITDLHQII